MKNEDIIRMMKEAGFYIGETDEFHPEWERFAALVAAHEREKQPENFAKAIAELVECCKVLAEENEAAVIAEREACAKVCDEMHEAYTKVSDANLWCAAAIRARGKND